MSDHLPECLHSNWPLSICICDRLRKAEQRRDQVWLTMDPLAIAYRTGYADALDKAREAVAALPVSGFFWRDEALAAIDALRGES